MYAMDIQCGWVSMTGPAGIKYAQGCKQHIREPALNLGEGIQLKKLNTRRIKE